MADNQIPAPVPPVTAPTQQTTTQQHTETSYTPLDVFVEEVKYEDGTQKPYEPMKIPTEERHKAKFAMPNNVDVSIQGLTEMYLPDSLIKGIVKTTNHYGREKHNGVFKEVTESEILIFFSIILYIGVVRLPAKKDYWCNHGMWPNHKPCQRMSFYRFEMIWRYIHLTAKGQQKKKNLKGKLKPVRLCRKERRTMRSCHRLTATGMQRPRPLLIWLRTRCRNACANGRVLCFLLTK